MRRIPLLPIGLVLALLVVLAAPAGARKEKKEKDENEAAESLPKLAAKARGFERRDGLLPLHLDRKEGKVWLELPPPRDADGTIVDLLYVEGLLHGMGSNDVGLDRGQLGDSRVVRLRRLGRKVLVEQLNFAFRADSLDEAERQAVDESFAKSVLWGGEIGALDPDGRALVDLTGFLLRDAHGVSRALRERGQGEYGLDEARSAVLPESCLAFPDNLELEAVLTYAGEAAGDFVRATVPLPDALTLVQHHSLIRLPDDGYLPRRFDPRAGVNAVTYLDYAAGLGEPVRRQLALRHRLRKLDPAAERSPVERPIVFYVDRGAPEPVRSALLDGAGWWAEAFERAGFVDAYRVELLPEGAHPLDVRYNVVQWVHRATRGWSYGGGAYDPRTGELLKGHVSLGSLRVRQDRLLFEGLLGAAKTGSGGPDDPIVLALARIRQLAAHEVGHSLGLAHNFAASTYGRASVMDYPAPLVVLGPDGEIDPSRAYATGVGDWDVLAVRYAYGEPPPGASEAEYLDSVVRDGIARGLLFLSDAEARPPGAADPRASLWDNGADPVTALEEALAVRARALERFGEGNVAPGRPLAELEEVLATVYLHHRYQLDAAVKVVGGIESDYAVRGDGQPPARIVGGERQRRGLAAVLRVLDPEVLDLPDPLLALLLPRPFESSPHREMFASATAPAFDALGAAATAADQAVAALLQPERLARLVDFHRRDPVLPGVEEVTGALLDRAFPPAAAPTPRLVEIERVLQRLVVERLIETAGDVAIRPEVRSRLDAALAEAQERLRRLPTPDPGARAHVRAALAEIDRYFDRPAQPAAGTWRPADPPPGSPIGGAGASLDLGGCDGGGFPAGG